VTRSPQRQDCAPYAYRRDAAVPAFDDAKPIFIFDGKCALCSGFVRLILRHDRKHKLRLLAAQTPLGEALFAHFGLKSGDYDSNILLIDGRALEKSEAAIRVFETLGAPWSLARVARLAPRPLRDGLYDIIARHRLAWFGARPVCYAPSAEDAPRFVQ
jgi:predicted DCC family thiol-disulfide oxidoreductase YuxK